MLPRDTDLCPQAWHAGLSAGLLRECRYQAGHHGWHRDATGNLAWGGNLTDEERGLAEALRLSRVTAV